MKNLKKVLGFVWCLMVALCLFTGCKRDETNYIMIDTAGLKRRGKIYEAEQ